MKKITAYKACDGSIHEDPATAKEHDALQELSMRIDNLALTTKRLDDSPIFPACILRTLTLPAYEADIDQIFSALKRYRAARLKVEQNKNP